MYHIVEAYENPHGIFPSATHHPSSGQASYQTSDLISSIHQSLDLHRIGLWGKWVAWGGYRHRDWATDYISLCLKAMEREVALVKTDQSVIPQDVNEATGLVMNAEVKTNDELLPLSPALVAQNTAWSLPSRHSRSFIDPSRPLIIDWLSAKNARASRGRALLICHHAGSIKISLILHHSPPIVGPAVERSYPPTLWITLRAGCYSWCHGTGKRWYFNSIEWF